MAKTRAVFVDRDGVINELVYFPDHGIIDTPFTVEQLKLMPGASLAIKKLHSAGYQVVIISNQPGIAKGHLSQATFDKIREKMHAELAKDGATVDDEYYCFHHPEAIIPRFRTSCDCRKPKPGMLLKAAHEMGIDLSLSWFIGDNLSDIKAGKNAGCRTILIGKMKCELCDLMDKEGIKPDFIHTSLLEAAQFIVK